MTDNKNEYVSKGIPILFIITYVLMVGIYVFLSPYVVNYILEFNIHNYIAITIFCVVTIIFGLLFGNILYSFYGTRSYLLMFLISSLQVLLMIGFDIYAFTGGGLTSRFPENEQVARMMIFGTSALVVSLSSTIAYKQSNLGCDYCYVANIIRFSHTRTRTGERYDKYKHHEATTEKTRIYRPDPDTSGDYEWGCIERTVPAHDEYLGKFEEITTEDVYICPICKHTKEKIHISEKKIEDGDKKRYV